MNLVISRLANRACTAASLIILSASSGAFSAMATVPAPQRAELASSIKALPAGTAAAASLSAAEMDGSIEFMLPLKMRNYENLRARIAKGEIISASEMSAKYYPLAADYQSVVNWLTGQGLTITRTDPNRLGILVSAPIIRVRQALQVDFGKVTVGNKTFVSAVTTPSVPASFAPLILGVNGLQPHIQPHKHSQRVAPVKNRVSAQPGPFSPGVANQPPYLISEILAAYNANALNVTGAGQKIAIVIDTFPNTSDLTSFWATNGINQSLSNIEFVQVISGGTYDPPSGEETLDVEWTSGIASGAKIKVYGTTDLSFINVDQAYQQILSDIPTEPDMRQVSLSFGLGETIESGTQIQTDAQYFAAMAAAGLNVFVSSGDSGSKEGGITEVSYPASDPSVTAVGGTSLLLRSCSGQVTSETVWDGSGGGISVVFDRPVWQTGASVPPGTKRLVPDISLVADPNTGALIVLDGFEEQIGGTSWSAPVWAGFCAMINQARKNASFPLPSGPLAAKLYPLLGTTALRDITSGDNGGFFAGIGYDLCTGIGVPSVATLIQPLTGGATPPAAPTPAPTPVPTPTPPYGQILTPDPTCPLPGSTVDFTWTAGNASAYWLTVGKTLGGSDIFSSGQTGGRFFTVSNLPTDGRNVYARLWSFVGGTWFNPPQDYVYTALAANVQPPVIAPGTGTYKKKVTVNMATGTPGATIYYTINGTTPTAASLQFVLPFVLKKTTTVRAIALKAGVPDSPVSAAGFTISKK